MYNEETREINLLPIVAWAVAIITVLVLALNMFTIVDAGTVKVQKLFGKTQAEPLTEGFHIVNPMADFVTFDVKESIYELNNLEITTADKQTVNANFTITYAFDGGSTPTILKEIGRQNEVVRKSIRQPLLSLIQQKAKSIGTYQELFKPDVHKSIEQFLTSEMKNNLTKEGIVVDSVLMQKTSLTTELKRKINETQSREEEVAREKAELDKQALIFERQVREAESKAKAEEQNKLAKKHKADAAFYTRQKEADAKLYLAKKEAEGNKLLARSVTPNLLQLKDKDIALTQAQRWTGNYPQTMLSGGSALPLWNLNK